MKIRTLALLLTVGSGLMAEEPLHEMGPFPTREMFPMYLTPMAYQPADPLPLGKGHWRWGLHWVEANTFQFSDLFTKESPRDPTGRIAVTRGTFASTVAAYPQIPTLYYFDEEIARFEVEGRYGLWDQTDVWFRLPVQNHTGGFLDPLIENFHKLGFEQYGRDRVLQNQVTLAVARNGKVTFFSDERILGKPQDPVLGLTHRLLQTATWTLSGTASFKLPITHTYDAYQSGWDQSYGFTGAWRNDGRHAFYFGASYLRRPHGSEAYDEIGYRDGVGAHATWEYRRWRTVQPFLQLYWQSGYLQPQPYQEFDRSSLQHDVGIHWHWTRRTTLTFHYMNNITHRGNTADMALGASLTAHF
ncbi:DUF3187 family protein [Geothrix sp. 21YS21S-4]|uniref:DUF3187 family protein n=1 Tax=Geothrix sp. 21YS21S-4 TaxID=3068889 RepID=UPI0027B9B8FD|nr:DUF3187 family protein [Geothrix sp. 21YS21S-4]